MWGLLSEDGESYRVRLNVLYLLHFACTRGFLGVEFEDFDDGLWISRIIFLGDCGGIEKTRPFVGKPGEST